MHTNNDTSTRLVYYQLHPRFTSHSSAIVLLTLTRVHLADLLYEGLIKTCNYGATYWNHKVLVQALYEGIDSSYTSTLMWDSGTKMWAITISVFRCELQVKWRMGRGWVVHTCCIRCMHLDDCTPYALLTMWGRLCLAHTVASSSSLQDKSIHNNQWWTCNPYCSLATVTSKRV